MTTSLILDLAVAMTEKGHQVVACALLVRSIGPEGDTVALHSPEGMMSVNDAVLMGAHLTHAGVTDSFG